MKNIKGWDWSELADMWGITVGKTISYIKECEDGTWQFVTEPWTEELEESNPAGVVKVEKYMKYYMDGDFAVRLTDEEDVLSEKIKDFLFSNLDEDTVELPKDIKKDLVDFLNKLAKNTDHGEKEIIKAIAESQDFTLVTWVCRNLRSLWC